MDVPTGILISFGNEEAGNAPIKPEEEPIVPPRRLRKGRSGAVTSTRNAEKQQHVDKGAEVKLRETNTAGTSPPPRPSLPPKRPQSMPVGPLVDFSSSSSADRVSDLTKSEMVEEHEIPVCRDRVSPVVKLKPMSPSESPEPVKLCGYLDKLGEKGIIKTYKTRWFVYENHRCRLYYYRTAQDLIPLGSIDISNASLNFNVAAETPGHFQICTEGRIYHLEAKDKQTKMFWLQELQQRRRVYSSQRTSLSRGRTSYLTSTTAALHQPTTGLVSTQKIKAKMGSDPWTGLPPILDRVELPTHSIGEATANSNPQSGVFNFSLSNMKMEIRNQMTSFGLKRTPSNCQEYGMRYNSLYIPEEEPEQPQKLRESSVKSTASVRSGDGRISPITDAAAQTDQSKQSQKSTGLKAGLIRKLTRSPSEGTPSPSSQWIENQQNGCPNCAKLQLEVSSLREEMDAMEGEVQASKEVINMLHKQLTATQMEKATTSLYLESKTDQQKIMILQRKDKQLIQLEQLLQEMRDDRDNIKVQLGTYQLKVENMNDQISMFTEMITAKDEIVVSLTNRIQELEKNEPIHAVVTLEGTTTFERRPVSPPSVDGRQSISSVLGGVDPLEHEKLKDACEAFEMQNKFLNNEILELNNLRQDDLLRENNMIEKYADLEANHLKTQSKYLLVLDELRGPTRDSEEAAAEMNTDEIISRLIEEAIKTDTLSTIESVQSGEHAPGSVKKEVYDRYGFTQHHSDDEDSDDVGMTLTSKAAVLKKRSEEIQTLRSSTEVSVAVKWENYLVTHGDKEIVGTPELKSLVRAGIPHEYRARIWKTCIEWRVKKDKETTGPGYYERLLKSEKFKSNPATKQIELDLLRTLPTNKHYDNIESPGIPKLRRVLKAFSVHDPSIGYCQGLNRLAAIALLYLEEEDAFWCMVCIVQYIMPAGYYSTTLVGSQTDQRVFKDLLGEKLPRLNAHLDQHEIDLSLITFNWFITCYCDNIPVETMLRIWDTMLYEGNKVLFRYGLAFFKCCEDQLLQLNDYISIFNFLRSLPSMMSDIQHISQVAFNELNPFPRRHINTKRIFHNQQVMLQLEELERMRNSIVTDRPNQDVMSDDEEEYDIVEALGTTS